MRGVIPILALLVIALGRAGGFAAAEESRVVDRIVAHVEGDIILESQVRELSAFQELIEGHAESDDKILDELIQQWVVKTEAEATHFPQPAQSEVDREQARLQDHLGGTAGYADLLKKLGLSVNQVKRLLSSQIYVERYLDYKFRPSVQVEPAQIDAYYQKELLPELAKNHQPAPSRTSVEEQIREVLIQRGISEQASKWLDDTKSRLKIEIGSSAGKS